MDFKMYLDQLKSFIIGKDHQLPNYNLNNNKEDFISALPTHKWPVPLKQILKFGIRWDLSTNPSWKKALSFKLLFLQVFFGNILDIDIT